MATTTYRLAFEQPIYRIEEQIAQLESTAKLLRGLADELEL